VPAVYVKVQEVIGTVPETVIVPALLNVMLSLEELLELLDQVPVPFITIEVVPKTMAVVPKYDKLPATLIVDELTVVVNVVPPKDKVEVEHLQGRQRGIIGLHQEQVRLLLMLCKHWQGQ